MSSPHFLSSGFSKASFQSLANTPDSNDNLIMFVITGNSTSKTSKSTEVGIGSSRHDFLAAFLMSSETCSWDNVLKLANVTPAYVSESAHPFSPAFDISEE